MRRSPLLITAIILYIAGILYFLDWMLFWNKHRDLVRSDYDSFKNIYHEHFPAFSRFITSHDLLTTGIMVIIFLFSGIVFITVRNTFFKVLGVSAFLLAGMFLFSMM